MTAPSADGGAAPNLPPIGIDAAGHGRIADIEFLRGVAVLFVLVEHMRINLFPWISGDHTRLWYYFGYWNGVDLFFVISGFVIARSLLPTLVSKSDPAAFFNAAIAFWVRRAWRLLPSAWLWLAIILVASATFNRTGTFGSFRANFEAAVAAMLDVANFRLVTVFGNSEPGASFPYWSLSLEEQFYIALPFLVFLLRRRLTLVLILAVAAQLFVTRSGPDAGWLGMFLNQFRTDAISCGVLIATWSYHRSYRLFEPTSLAGRGYLRIAVTGLLVFLLAATGSQHLHLVWFQVGLATVISAALVLIATYDKDYVWPDGMFKRVMLWVGSRSYALYLIHVPVYFMTREIWYRIEPPGTVFEAPYGLRFGLTAAVLLLSFAEVNYRFVELPLRRRGARIADRISRRAI